jgi:sigma-E factor negative regulatory protein RseC
MLEAGTVLQAQAGRATVRMERSSACAECGLCHNVGHEARDLMLEASNPIGAQVGDVVRLDVPDVGVVKASFVAYGVPLIAAVIGGVIGWPIGARLGASGETGAIVGGLATFVAALYGVSRYDRRMRGTWAGPRIVEVLHSGASLLPRAPQVQG